MAETPSHKPKGIKDKNCPYCHQAFTSSSLGRHLDLYIRERNPKPPDGVHDVEAIRKIRENITRRRPHKGAVARRDTLAPAGTPIATSSRKSSASGVTEHPAARSPLSPRDASRVEAITAGKYPFKHAWEATGVINELVPRERHGDANRAGEDGDGRGARPGAALRSVSRQTLKQRLDMRQQVQETQDRARAAELALRELVGSLRAAKQQIDTGSAPFAFDPFSLDFPALTLQCLEPPPTLFASTQQPTPTSWSILPPGQTQLNALRSYFQEEFRRHKFACTVATTAVTEELTYPPPLDLVKTNTKAEVRKAEKAAEKMEQHVYDHLEATYSIWSGLAQEQREQLWRLELARGVGRKQKEVAQLKEGQHLLKQEIEHLKKQIGQLTRLQQPREFKIAPPSTVFIDEKLLGRVLEEGLVSAKPLVSVNLADRHADLNTIISRIIDRWKNVIVSARSAGSGLQTQRPLNATGTGESNSGTAGGAMHPSQTRQQEPQQPEQSVPGCQNLQQAQDSATPGVQGTIYAASATSTVTVLTPPTATAAAASSATAPSATAPSIGTHADGDEDEDMSDQDADADADADLPGQPRDDVEGAGDADGDTDADGDADMNDDPGYYTDAQLHSAQPPPQQHRLHPMWEQLAGARTRQTMSGARRSAMEGGTTGMGHTHACGRMPGWI